MSLLWHINERSVSWWKVVKAWKTIHVSMSLIKRSLFWCPCTVGKTLHVVCSKQKGSMSLMTSNRVIRRDEWAWQRMWRNMKGRWRKDERIWIKLDSIKESPRTGPGSTVVASSTYLSVRIWNREASTGGYSPATWDGAEITFYLEPKCIPCC
jgi:hypothetical protein